MTSAALEAYRVTQNSQWYKEARRAFEWFLGNNDLGVALYNPTTGGCHDALQIDRLNQNQGAESTLSFLLALTEMYLTEIEMVTYDETLEKTLNTKTLPMEETSV